VLGYNVNDGVLVGYGVEMRGWALARRPGPPTYLLTGAVAVRTGAFNFGYEGNFHQGLAPIIGFSPEGKLPLVRLGFLSVEVILNSGSTGIKKYFSTENYYWSKSVLPLHRNSS
jgi:hypothetical protein